MTATGARPIATAGPPRERGGWWHNFVCPVHGVELAHGDLFAERFPDGGAACAHGCTVDTPLVRGAWYVLAHQAWARRIRVLAHTGDRTEAVRLLVTYAELYDDLATTAHEQAESWMLRGRLFQQALTEAIWAASIGHAVWTLADQGVANLAPVLPLLDGLTAHMAAARAELVADGKFTSNYVAWLNAAGIATSRAAALVRGVPWAGTEEWIRGPHGVFAHVLASTRPDGWQWEASTYYHGFVLRAVLLALRGTDPARWPVEVVDRVRSMTAVLEGVAAQDGTLPALHDGPNVRAPLALEWLELAALAPQATSSTLDQVVDRARYDAGASDDGLAGRLDGWFAAAPRWYAIERAPVTVFADAGYAVLRGDGIHAVLAFGPHGGSHGHLDKLSLSLHGEGTPWQPDPGQVPYGHRPLRAYYASTAAHPCFAVDGLDQQACTGRLLRSTTDTVAAEVTGAYPGVRATRGLHLGAGYLLDVVRIAADRPSTLTVHLRPDCDFSLQAGAVRSRSTWSGARVLRGAHVCDVPAIPLLRPGPGPADDPQRVRAHVDWTATGATTATFCSVYSTAAVTLELADTAVLVTVDGATVRHDLEDLC